MSNAVSKDKKAVCIQQSEMGDVVAQGLARALEARKMAELTGTELLDGVSGGVVATTPIVYPFPFPWGIYPPLVIDKNLSTIAAVGV